MKISLDGGLTARSKSDGHEFIRVNLGFHEIDASIDIEVQIADGLDAIDKAWPKLKEQILKKAKDLGNQ